MTEATETAHNRDDLILLAVRLIVVSTHATRYADNCGNAEGHAARLLAHCTKAMDAGALALLNVTHGEEAQATDAKARDALMDNAAGKVDPARLADEAHRLDLNLRELHTDAAHTRALRHAAVAASHALQSARLYLGKMPA